nr:MAG TPA_asm: hypothetical protein [Caudoviricetes sp.]
MWKIPSIFRAIFTIIFIFIIVHKLYVLVSFFCCHIFLLSPADSAAGRVAIYAI